MNIEDIIKDHPIPTASSGMNITVPDSKQLTDLAKAIEQYVIKARIEEAEHYDYNIWKDSDSFYEAKKQRIAQLKKGVE